MEVKMVDIIFSVLPLTKTNDNSVKLPDKLRLVEKHKDLYSWGQNCGERPCLTFRDSNSNSFSKTS